MARRSSAGVGSVESRQEAQKNEEAHELNEKIIERLRCLAAEGRLLGAGLYVGTGLRQDIPLELWANARFELDPDGSYRENSNITPSHCGSQRTPRAEDDLAPGSTRCEDYPPPNVHARSFAA